MELGLALLREETYTFTPNDGDQEVHIFSGQLRKWLLANAMDRVIDLHFPPDETLEQLTERHGLEAPRLESMTEAEASEPVIIGMWPGGTHILIDGGHRRAYWALRGVHTLKGFPVPYEVWNAFTFDPADLAGLVIHGQDGSLLPQRSKSSDA